ncbi:hypothetical protein KM92DES2_12843 [uncultured Desulfovibrio sp.]|uniref:Uncharacterized protein n=1 Tax=uncultured Desulfovibrio sp. TaxID=167968 RepID=A0A212KE15_9BACT|nr:hypothetical protein KM92DES2_12843 [uncultured Desulfovibrio sp.]
MMWCPAICRIRRCKSWHGNVNVPDMKVCLSDRDMPVPSFRSLLDYGFYG